MGGLRRPPLDPHWRDRAECREYDPELWSVGDDGEEDHPFVARPICVEHCTVREFCLRYALRDDPPNVGVMRGGIEFVKEPRVRCRRCKYPVADPRTRVCAVCTLYDPCLGGCGRLVSKDRDSWYCIYCTAARLSAT